MTTCFIIDDEFSAINLLTDYVKMTPNLELSGSFRTPLAALEKFHAGLKPDIVFMDINMPELTGIQMAPYIPSGSAIIFTTAEVNLAVDAFECSAFDYLLKPIAYHRFIKSIERFQQNKKTKNVADHNDHFFIQSELKGKMLRINFDDFIFAESVLNYLKIHTVNGSHITYLKLTELMANLPPAQFTRVHKSFVINNKKVVSVEKNNIHLNQNHIVSIGDSYREGFLKLVKDKLLKTQR